MKKSLMVDNKKIDLVFVKDKNDKVECYIDYCSYGGCGLSENIIDQQYLVCPLHGCYYSVQTGEIMQGPTMFSIHKFQMQELKNSQYIVEIDKQYEKIHINYKKSFLPDTFKNIVIVGNSYGILEFIRSYRQQNNYTGQFIVFTSSSSLEIEDYYSRLKNIFFFNPMQMSKRLKEMETKLNVKLNDREMKEINGQGIRFKDKGEVVEQQMVINLGCKYEIEKEVEIISGSDNTAKVVFPNSDLDLKEIKKVVDGNQHKRVVIYGINKRSMQMMETIRKYSMEKNIEIVLMDPDSKQKSTVFELDFLLQSYKPLFNSRIKQIKQNEITYHSNKSANNTISFDLLIYMNNHNPQVDLLCDSFKLSPNRHVFTNHNLLCQLEIFCLGSHCNHYDWLYPAQSNIENESQQNVMARMVAANMISNSKVYTAMQHDFIETEKGTITSIGKLNQYNKIKEVEFKDENDKKRQIKLYYMNQFMIGASTIDSPLELLYIREYILKGKIVTPKVVDQISKNDFTFYHDLFKPPTPL